jgi:diguanylate cyclase (GGDEF)-like protein/PAS domain S-box-containing protein
VPHSAEIVLEAAGVGGWELDVASGQLNWTAITFRIFELEPPLAPSLAEVMLYYPPEARVVLAAAVQAAVEAGTPWDIETGLVTAGGRRRWVRSWGLPVRDGGRTVRIVGAFQDVTDRREQTARTERLMVVAGQMTNIVITTDRDGRIDWVNGALTRLTGLTLAQVQGRKPGDLLQGAGTDPVTIGVMGRGVRDGTGFDVEVLNYTGAGAPYWVAITCSPLRDEGGVVNGFIAVETDITVRRAAEASARAEAAERGRAEALLQDVLDALPSGITAHDRDGRFVMCNRRFAEMFPITARFSVPGRTYPEIIRLAAEHGQYPDAPAEPVAREAWLAALTGHTRDGMAHELRLPGGRFAEMVESQSQSGNHVTVRTDITELKRAEARAAASAAERERAQALLRDVVDAVPSAIVAYDGDERIILTNPADAERAMPASFSAPGERLEDVMRLAIRHGYFLDAPAAPDARERWACALLTYLRGTDAAARVMRLGDGRTVQVSARRSASGNLVIIRTDISELARAQALLRDILEALPSAVIAYDRDERLVLWNRAAVDLLPPWGEFAAVGRTLEEMMRMSAVSGAYLDAGSTAGQRARWGDAMLAAYRTGSEARTMRLRDGRFLHALERRSGSGNLVCVRTDTTELKRAEQDLRWQAERDSLTRLHNRSFFMAMLDRALDADTRGDMACGLLLLVDIDDFKQINDTLGHDMGDALLVEMATRLRRCVRGRGEGVARLGGDEFGVVIPGLGGPAAAGARLDALHAALSAPAALGGRRTALGISMGVTAFPADGTDATKLLKTADLALYEAKRNGRGRWASFRPEQVTAQERHERMADALRGALAQNRLTVALQPKRRLRDGAHAGFEALARWHDGTRWVPPLEFIPVAEDTGLIRPLGRVIMEAALGRVAALRRAGLEPGRVAVNVTGPQLLDAHFRDETLAALRRHRLRAADLELELTETVLFGRASERIDAVLREFRADGVTLALDDFGTGYASLAHLSRLPIDRLKIDRSFVEGIASGGAGGVIARTVVSLAQGLGMEAIAEGVETEAQMGFLREVGCDVVQGYLVSMPLLTVGESVAYLRGRPGPVRKGARAVAA